MKIHELIGVTFTKPIHLTKFNQGLKNDNFAFIMYSSDISEHLTNIRGNVNNILNSPITSAFRTIRGPDIITEKNWKYTDYHITTELGTCIFEWQGDVDYECDDIDDSLKLEVAPKKYRLNLTHNEAVMYCFSLNINGKVGWRLPTKLEWSTLVTRDTKYNYSFEYNWIAEDQDNVDSDKVYMAIPIRTITK